MQVAAPVSTVNIGLIGAAAVAASAMAGAVGTEEVRYRMLRSLAPVARSLDRKRTKDGSKRDYRLLKAISRRPGLGIHELRELLPRDKPTMSKLALLERDGYVSSVRARLTRRFYSVRTLSLSDASVAISIHEPTATRIIHEIESNPGIWEAKLAKNLGLSQQSVHYHLRKLQASEILTAVSMEKRKHYWLRGSPHSRENARLAS
jgi:predicted transcriptional regulator